MILNGQVHLGVCMHERDLDFRGWIKFVAPIAKTNTTPPISSRSHVTLYPELQNFALACWGMMETWDNLVHLALNVIHLES